MTAAERYSDVNTLWAATAVPAISRHEAERAARALYRKFGRKKDFPRQLRNLKFTGEARHCWITSKPVQNSDDRGWPRLVHDVSHMIFRRRYPQFRPHHPLHAGLELEIAQFVLDVGWLTGNLKPKAKTKPSTDDVRARKLANIDAALERWDSKLRRAQNAIKKLQRRRARLV